MLAICLAVGNDLTPAPLVFSQHPAERTPVSPDEVTPTFPEQDGFGGDDADEGNVPFDEEPSPEEEPPPPEMESDQDDESKETACLGGEANDFGFDIPFPSSPCAPFLISTPIKFCSFVRLHI